MKINLEVTLKSISLQKLYFLSLLNTVRYINYKISMVPIFANSATTKLSISLNFEQLTFSIVLSKGYASYLIEE